MTKKNPQKASKTIDYQQLSEDLAEKLSSANEALLRERADSANVRRRAEEDRIKMARFYKADVVRELLPTIDNIERALKSVPDDLTDHQYTKGIQGIAKQFDQFLEKIGVERIKTAGELFDPQLHEAVSMEENDGSVEVVSDELQAGYKIGDEVIRHAMVRVTLR